MDLKQEIQEKDVVILPPMDYKESCAMVRHSGLFPTCTILDPWYNRGVGGEMPLAEYDVFIHDLLERTARICDVIYLWGFPEIIGAYVRDAPIGFSLTGFLTWYYKNCPTVIKGWRSSQQSCLQFQRYMTDLHPENFMSPEAREKFEEGKARFIPGPSSVIEESLLCGFVGKKEQVGHPAQKPSAVFEKLILMATEPGDIVFDPMAGSGTTAAAARKLGRRAIVCDHDSQYIEMIKKRLKLPTK